MDPENRNVGKPWSAMDLFDLKNSLAYGSWVKEIAEFLMRREIEVREKMLELGLKERRKLT
jgi:DNA-binding SARP family transcriptional activator